MDENRESGKRKEWSSRCHLFTGQVSLVTWVGRISAAVFVGGGHRISTLVVVMVIQNDEKSKKLTADTFKKERERERTEKRDQNWWLY